MKFYMSSATVSYFRLPNTETIFLSYFI